MRLDETNRVPSPHRGQDIFYIMRSAQTGSVTQLAVYSIGTGSKSSLDVDLATDIHLVPS